MPPKLIPDPKKNPKAQQNTKKDLKQQLLAMNK
jgi:hypothetical protein